jgi:hypothetical protein
VYVACRGLHQQEIKAQELPPIPGLKIRGSYATATQRLQVDYPPGYRDKFATAWKRPDEWRQAHYDGWTIADDVELKGAHFGSHTGGGEGPITVGAGGETELLLMKMPKEMKEQRQRATSEKSRGRAKKVEQSTISEMRRAGGVPYVPPEKESSDGHNWS